jgi:two-component system OmpR family sensor kinase
MSLRRPKLRLVWRLILIGVVQLFLVVAAVVLVGIAMTRVPPPWDMSALTQRIRPALHEPKALQALLDEVRAKNKLRVSIYDRQSQVVASNVMPALPAPRWGSPPGEPEFAAFPEPPTGDGARYSGPPPGSPRDFGRPPPGAPRLLPRAGLAGHPPNPLLAAGLDGPRRSAHLPDFYARITSGVDEFTLVARIDHLGPSRWPPILTLLLGLSIVGVGALLTARWIARPVEQLSRAAGALGQGDLRVRAQLNRGDELGELGKAFDEMAERIQVLLQAEKELLANVAHELRTPLARIRVALEIASEGDHEVARDSLAEIALDLSELETLVNDVLRATRFEIMDGKAVAAAFALRRQATPPALIGEQAHERFALRHPARPLRLTAAKELPEVFLDPMLFRRVIDNLLENAHKYSPDETRAIEVRITSVGERVEFVVEDQGMGVATADLPRIFDAFFRGERSRSRVSGGVGLGLTLAKRIVEAHGGTISVESTVGVGTLLRVSMPIYVDERFGAPSGSQQSTTPA